MSMLPLMVEFSTTIFGQGQCWCPWPTLPLKVTCMLMVCAAAWSHVDIQGLCCHRENWKLCDLCCHLRSRWCSWLVLLPRPTMVSMALAEQKTLLMPLVCTENHAEVCGMIWCWRACRCPRSVLFSETMCKFMLCFPAECDGQGSCFHHGIDDCRLTAKERDMECFCDNSYPTSQKKKKNNSLSRISLSRKIIHWQELFKLLKMW